MTVVGVDSHRQSPDHVVFHSVDAVVVRGTFERGDRHHRPLVMPFSGKEPVETHALYFQASDP